MRSSNNEGGRITALGPDGIPSIIHKATAPSGHPPQQSKERDQQCGEIKLAAFTPLKKDQGELGEATIETPKRGADDAGPETYR